MWNHAKKLRGQRSDNFEATGRAHSSFWSFLPIVLGELIEIGITFEIVGPRPPWSQIIQICVLKKPCFRHNFWTETLISPIFTTSTPPCHTCLESYGSHGQFGTNLSRFEGSYRPSEFWWHGGTEPCHWSESLSYINDACNILFGCFLGPRRCCI